MTNLTIVPNLRGSIRIWLVMLLPTAIILTAAVAMNKLDLELAAWLGAGIAILSAVVALRHMQNLDGAIAYLLELESAPGMAEPVFDPFTFGPRLYDAIVRLKSVMAHQKAEHDLQEKLADALINGLPFPILVLDAHYDVENGNKAAHVLFERPLQGVNIAQLMRSEPIFEALEDVVSSGATVWREFAEHAGMEAIYRVHIAPIDVRGKVHFLIMIEDLTEQRRSDQMRVDFIANASHEIRTPLTAVRGMIDTINGPAGNDPTAQRQFLGMMGEQVERLHHLVEDLMSLSRIELHERSRPGGAVYLSDLVDVVTHALKWEANQKQITFRVEIPATLPALLGEAEEIERLISNLVVNAIKYGAPNTEVRIAAYMHERPSQLPGWKGGDRAVALAIADRGAGIPAEHIPRLTERFYRVDAARSRNLGGTGLGLAIVKHIVQRHRGALVIDSVLNQGSIFTAYFPAYTEAEHVPMSSAQILKMAH